MGVGRACAAFGVSRRSYNHRRQAAEGRLPARPSKAKPVSEHRPVPWKLSPDERARVRDVLCSERFGDLAPAQVYATLLDEGTYLCSERTMYRILHEHDLVRERRRGHRRHGHAPPRVHATGPNQAWSWDISRLRGPARGRGSTCTRVGHLRPQDRCWSIDTIESDKVAKTLISRGWPARASTQTSELTRFGGQGC